MDWLGSVIETYCAGEDVFLRSLNLPRAEQAARRYVYELPFAHRLGFKLAVFLLIYVTPPLTGSLGPFYRLKLESRLRCLLWWERNRFDALRNVYRIVKYICVGSLMSEPDILRAIGFGPTMDARLETK